MSYHVNGIKYKYFDDAQTAADEINLAAGRVKAVIRKGIVSKLSAASAKQQGLEVVFSPGNQWHERIFYDPKEGKYYDANSDVYLSLQEAAAFGLR